MDKEEFLAVFKLGEFKYTRGKRLCVNARKLSILLKKNLNKPA